MYIKFYNLKIKVLIFAKIIFFLAKNITYHMIQVILNFKFKVIKIKNCVYLSIKKLENFSYSQMTTKF